MAAIEDAIGRLLAAFGRAGLPPVRPPADPGPLLAEIDLELAPLRLPDQLRTFWTRVDPRTLTVAPDPTPTGPGFALHLWRDHRDHAPGMTPRLLFPVSYESHRFLLVELDRPDGRGGACFDWSYGGTPFTLHFRDLAAYLDLFATMIETGRFGGPVWSGFEPEDWDDARRVRLPAAELVEPYGERRELDEDVRHWPAHWLAWDGPVTADREPRGVDATIEGLAARASATGAPARGRIHARVVGLAMSNAGRRASVADSTGVLDVWCPAAVCTFGPVMDRSFEFEVVVRPDGEPGAPPLTPAAEASPLGGPSRGPSGVLDPERDAARDAERDAELDEARALTDRLHAELFETSRGAEASAVRPLD